MTVLAQLEKELDRPIATSFDLLAGTSIGGIIALGLAAEVPAADIKQAFEENGTRIFSNRPVPKSTLNKIWDVIGRSVLSPKYDGKALRETINSIVGQDAKIADLKHPVIIPAVNLTKGSPQVFKTPHHQMFTRDLHLSVSDVALATSAAPIYFPIAEVGDELFADGGLYANAPDLLGLHESEHYFKVPAEEIRILSIGTTTSKFSFSHVGGNQYGILKWMRDQRLVNAILASQQMISDFMLRHKLGDRYVRIDALQSKEQERDLALDVATPEAQRTTRALAEAAVREFINNKTLRKILAHRAPTPSFYQSNGRLKANSEEY